VGHTGIFSEHLRPYTDAPAGKSLAAPELNLFARNFERSYISLISPGIEYSLQGCPAAITISPSVAVDGSNVLTGEQLIILAYVDALSNALAVSAPDLTSAAVLAD
jgi:hypothetical protein